MAVRRKQFTAPRLKIARTIAARKILSYELEPSEEKRALARLAKALTTQEIMTHEGRATRAYWQRWAGFPLAFRDKVPPHWRAFQTRVSARFLRTARTAAVFSARGARHPLNALLNYAYAVALAQVTRAIIGRGLDPVYGFLHADRIGRLSFSYDALELFRAQIDAMIFKFAGLRKFSRADFVEVEDGVIRLSSGIARQVAALILRSISFHEFERAVTSIAELF